MANRNEKAPGNVPGKFYVDLSCIDCDMCRNTAPGIFIRDEEIAGTIVTRQPITTDEILLANSALTGCPTDSIGADGEEPRV
jgi:ferredoxin